ncbi:DsbA family protein [Thioclava sp. GXIMD4216]|uniref:DsbA family protein n=1 Tax=Thioclava litoralis TaxID=3076557 RepID=A0ABZ1DYJ6_9RHOB|nr:DsbA family protein [Thioclava sp. FTW29]
MTRKLLPAFALSALLAQPAGALDLGSMTDSERADFGRAVRNYLMDNPEVLMEAINELEKKQNAQIAQNDQQLIATNEDELTNDPESWVGGNPDGDVTIVEFMDYRCGYCKKAYPEINALLKSDGHIRFIVKEFPILGDASVKAARFAIATKQVAGDEAYEKVHNALMTLRGDISDDSLSALAKKLDLDGDAIQKAAASPEVEKVIEANYALGQRMGLSGTPSFVIGDEMLRGYAPEEAMKKIVADQRG